MSAAQKKATQAKSALATTYRGVKAAHGHTRGDVDAIADAIRKAARVSFGETTPAGRRALHNRRSQLGLKAHERIWSDRGMPGADFPKAASRIAYRRRQRKAKRGGK